MGLIKLLSYLSKETIKEAFVDSTCHIHFQWRMQSTCELKHTIFWSESDVVIEKLSELHDHVGVPRVRRVGVRVVLLRDPPGVGQRRRVAAAPRTPPAVVVRRRQHPPQRRACRSPFRLLWKKNRQSSWIKNGSQSEAINQAGNLNFWFLTNQFSRIWRENKKNLLLFT